MCLPNKIDKFCNTETWVDIPEHERYQISCFGNIRHKKKSNVLKLRLRKGEHYYKVRFGNCQNKDYTVHSLALHAFVGPRPEGLEIDHIDGNKLNNKISNLEYVTHEENCRRAKVLMLMHYGSDSGYAKLTWEQVNEIREIYKPRPTLDELALKYGVTRETIRKIVTFKTYPIGAEYVANRGPQGIPIL